MSGQGHFKDHFSRQSGSYADARPHYPQALFHWLAAQAPGRRLAWEAGCGSGQATGELGRLFEHVHASDPSTAQLERAPQLDNVDFRAEPAEQCSLASGTADLACAAQAAHWFDLPRYYAEVRRVLRPGGLLAVWTYGLHVVDPTVDAVLAELYDGILGRYWPPERTLVEGGYRDLAFPCALLATPKIQIELDWNLGRYLDYLSSWSATSRYIADTGTDPVHAMAEQFAVAWGEGERRVRWPVHLLAGYPG